MLGHDYTTKHIEIVLIFIINMDCTAQKILYLIPPKKLQRTQTLILELNANPRVICIL